MIFALLVKSITIHMRISIVEVWEPSLEKPFARFKYWKSCLYLGLLLALDKQI